MKLPGISFFFVGTLRRRLITSVALVHAVLMTIFVADLVLKSERALCGQQSANAASLASTLAASSAGWLAARDVAGLQELVEVQRSYPDLWFSMIMDSQGRVMAHTDRTRLRQLVVDIPKDGEALKIIQSPDMVDACVPVILSGRRIGWVRVGLSQQGMSRNLRIIVKDGIIYAITAIFIGSVLAWIMGTLFARRMQIIQRVMESVRSGDLKAQVTLPGHDEVAELAAGLDQMLETLRQRTREITVLNASLEQRVEERTNQLQCINRELEAFAYSVSHDLRAPLRAIDGFSVFLEQEAIGKLDAEGMRLLGVIRSNARKMDRLILDLLTLSRATQTELKYVRIDMPSLVKSVYNEIATAEVRKLFAFTLEPLPEAWGDPGLLRQVWVNLLANAVKYSMKSPLKEIEVGGYLKDGEHVYFVRDSGAGFNPEYTSKLFGAFQRLHKAEDFEGSGIGLATVQRIIHRHGGRVWAEGRENAGAKFYFSLPGRSNQYSGDRHRVDNNNG